MKTRKIFSFVAALLAMLMVLSACGAASSTPTATEASSQSANTQATEAAKKAADPVTITYCNFNSSGGNEETLAKMVAAFEASHPDIKVEVETIGYDDYFTQMQTRVAGGTAPDCYELNIENFAAYANKGLLAEISGVDVSGLNDTALNAFCVNGKQYGLPESFSNVVLIYNKDLFDQAGVSYPTSDWTQDDVQAAAEAIRALGDDIYGIWQPITYNEFFKVVAQYGGALLNEDKTQFTINSPENLKAAQTLIDRVLVSNVQPNAAQQGGMGDWDMFMSGRLGHDSNRYLGLRYLHGRLRLCLGHRRRTRQHPEGYPLLLQLRRYEPRHQVSRSGCHLAGMADLQHRIRRHSSGCRLGSARPEGFERSVQLPGNHTSRQPQGRV